MLFILLGAAISLQSFSGLLVAFIFFLIINFTWIKHEEEKLDTTFNEEWKEYSEKTRRWL